MISTILESNSYNYIKKIFEEHNIYCKNLREKIFYQILQNRCIMSEFVHDQFTMRKIYGVINNQFIFKIKENEIENVFTKERVDDKTFHFFDCLDETNFINISENLELLDLIKYSKVSLNLNIDNVIEKVTNLLGIFIDDCLLAGGYFTNYISLFNQNLKCIYDAFQIKKDIDLFFCYVDSIKYHYYLNRIQNDFKMVPFDVNINDYKFNSFKVVVNNHYLGNNFKLVLNFVFFNKMSNESNFNNKSNVIDCVHNFDFTLCKIFYSFRLKCIYMHSEMFSPMIDFKLVLDSKFNFNDATQYHPKLKEIIEICEIIDSNQIMSIQYLESKEQIFVVVPETKLIFSFLNNEYMRTLKYVFKGAFINENISELENDLLNIYDQFKPYLIARVSMTKDELELNDTYLFNLFCSCLGIN
jgi:hypothetical protein